ncbi:MAG: TonB-dependent receptor [Mucilaginibacter sp.]|uniref:TonB-dependent receptor domain-containing protein n=1 Tax=Mucilaginibacter sp. TaxID=1882438 RepID=UPI003263696A
MKIFLLTLFTAFVLLNSVLAQTQPSKSTIKGSIIDSVKNQPMAFVTVLLKDSKTNQSVKSVLTKDNGTFEVSVPTGKTYQAIFAFIGYRSKTVNVPEAKEAGQIVSLGKLLLSETNNSLKEVSIVAAKPLIKQEVDRIAYDVQADPESKALSALDMVRKVPLLSVDANDNIKLKGQGNYKILINGKESALMAKNPSDVLKSMPATNIEKIEVITTPPAKYDAEGLAGIINIITKKNADQGYNGSINGRMNTVWGPGINLNGTVKQGKFGLAGYLGYGSNGRNRDNYNGSNQVFINQNILLQNAYSKSGGDNTYGNAELSYEIDTLNLITASYEFYGGKFDQNGDQLTSQQNGLGSVFQKYTLTNTNTSTFKGADASLNYQLGFKRDKEQLLTISYKYSYSPNEQNNLNEISNTLGTHPNSYQQYNKSGNREHTFQLDYVQPFNKKINIEAGGKAILRNNFSDFQTDTLNTTTGKYTLAPLQSNNFTYHQDVYSLYNSYQLKFEKWVVKAGLRIEHTALDADFTSAGTAIAPNYNNVIPSVSGQYKLKSSSLTLGYTQRIQRPGIYQLNPFIDKTNPKFQNTGNPDLRPELSNTFELNYSNFSKGSVTIGMSYAFSNNSIQNVTNTVEQINNGKKDTVTITTFQNLGSNKTLGLNMNTNLTFFKKMSVSINAQVSHVWLQGNYSGTTYANSGFGGNVFANVGYKFDKGYRLGFNSGYFVGDVNLQGRNGNYLYTSYVAGVDVLKKKATISLVANNPYSKYFTSNSTTNTTNFYQTAYYQNPYASFAVRFNYRFGKLNSNIKQNQRGIKNDDTKGGGGAKTSGN